MNFFEQLCAFCVLGNFFIGLLVFAIKALENLQNRIFSKKKIFIFFVLEVEKTTFRWIFEKKSIFQNNDIFYLWDIQKKLLFFKI